ncbi:hypothetical protein [Aquibium microcysteis]|uniref:hypothetical protein n=1 Tax=Aquibium microcysteis TaxID=675281 RepID=UPI00165D2D33|nr:hypothetical protein [Aquibium microcysteis]
MDGYSRSSADCTADEEKIPTSGSGSTSRKVDKKVKRTHAKSVGRDAAFRPVFQAFVALDQVRAAGGTSVTYHTPSYSYPYPFHSTLNRPTHRTVRLNASVVSHAPLITETLDDEEEDRTARFWHSRSFQTARTYRTPAEFRDLSDEFAVEWFHYGLQTLGPTTDFTLNLSPEIEAKAKQRPEWLLRRLRYHLQKVLGRKPEFWFALELSKTGRLHMHGEIQAAPDELEAVRKALRKAGGEWPTVRQHQAQTRPNPRLPWANYSVKDANLIRPFRDITRPINGDWLFASNGVKQAGRAIYEPYRERVVDFLASQDKPRAPARSRLMRRICPL